MLFFSMYVAISNQLVCYLALFLPTAKVSFCYGNRVNGVFDNAPLNIQLRSVSIITAKWEFFLFIFWGPTNWC